MRIAGIRTTSLNDGLGINYVIFMQGCKRGCPQCHNKETWNLNDGVEMSTYDVMDDIDKYEGFITGVTFSGGEPVLQWCCVEKLAEYAKTKGLTTTLYTGYKVEELAEYDLTNIDYIIDGEYLDFLPTEKPFRGSDNQKMYKNVKGRFIEI